MTKIGLPLTKAGLTPPTKSILISLVLTVAFFAVDSGIQKKMSGSETTTLIIIMNEKLYDIFKLVDLFNMLVC